MYLTIKQLFYQNHKLTVKDNIYRIHLDAHKLCHCFFYYYYFQTIIIEETEKERDDVLRQRRTGQKRYAFDAVFGEDSTQVK